MRLKAIYGEADSSTLQHIGVWLPARGETIYCMNRRHFLKRWLRAVATVGTTAVTGVAPLLRTANAGNDALDLATLTAVADTIVPGDEAPGAVDAGVVSMLVSSIERDPRARKHYALGLVELNRYTLETVKKKFPDLDPETRARVLSDLTTGAWWRRAAAYRMIALARNHVLVLFYSSPAAYQMLDYTAPRFGYLKDRETTSNSGIRDG